MIDQFRERMDGCNFKGAHASLFFVRVIGSLPAG